MGCCLCRCRPKYIPYNLEKKLGKFSNIEVITADESTPERVQEFKAAIDDSFVGTSKTAPEGMVYWMVEGEHSDGEPLLNSSPNFEGRKEIMKWVSDALFDEFNAMRTCLALIDESTNKIASAVILVNNTGDNNELHSFSPCSYLRLFLKFGLPRVLIDFGDLGKRTRFCDKITSSMHKKHMHGKHWYIAHIGTSPDLQGKGYGKRMLSFLEELFDADGYDAYLESTGERNTGFYTKFGFEVCESVKLDINTSSTETIKSTNVGGEYFCVMIRPGKKAV